MARRSILALCGAALLLVGAASFAGVPSWLGGSTVKGNGIVKTQAREVKGFSGVALGMQAQVEVRQGDSERVTIEADENLLPLIETRVEDGMLRIRTTERNLDLEATKLRIVVQARQIDRLAVGGSGSIASQALRSPQLRLEIGGSGSIEVGRAEIETGSVSIGGSGNVKIGGTARKLSVSIGGSGDVVAGQLKARDVAVNIGGSGNALVWASDALNAAIAGSGDVKYYGDPKLQTSIVGSGRAKRTGAAPQ